MNPETLKQIVLTKLADTCNTLLSNVEFLTRAGENNPDGTPAFLPANKNIVFAALAEQEGMYYAIEMVLEHANSEKPIRLLEAFLDSAESNGTPRWYKYWVTTVQTQQDTQITVVEEVQNA